MTGRIENLLAQPLGDFYGLKDLNCSPLEDRVQGLVHGNHLNVVITTYPCCYCNIKNERRFETRHLVREQAKSKASLGDGYRERLQGDQPPPGGKLELSMA